MVLGDVVEGGKRNISIDSVSAHDTLHDISNICHAVFKCLKLSLGQISEENTDL